MFNYEFSTDHNTSINYSLINYYLFITLINSTINSNIFLRKLFKISTLILLKHIILTNKVI